MSETVELTEAERTCLRWCAEVNPLGVGFLGPSVRRFGPVAEYQRLVDRGLVRLVRPPVPRSENSSLGYWLPA